jgi:hypothetical protein
MIIYDFTLRVPLLYQILAFNACGRQQQQIHPGLGN